MAITFIKNEKIILITIPQTTVTIQELLNAIRDYEDEITTMDIPHLADASGKENLGGGVFVGITLELLDNWRIKFQDRCSEVCDDPSYTGDSFVQCSVTGGNIVTTNDFNNSTIAPSGCTQVTITSSSSATIAELEIANLQQLIEMQRPTHAGVGNIWYWDPWGGNDTNTGVARGTATKTFARAQELAAAHNGDVIVAVPGDPTGLTTTSEVINFTKAFLLLRGPGRDFNIQSNDMTQPSITIESGAEMCEVSSIRIAGAYVPHSEDDPSAIVPGHGYLKDHVGITIEADNTLIKDIWISNVHADGIRISNSEYTVLENVYCINNGSHGIHLHNNLDNITLRNCHVDHNAWDGIHIDGDNVSETFIIGEETITHNNGWYGVRIDTGAMDTLIDRQITTDADELGHILDNGTNTHYTGQDINEAYNEHVVLDPDNGRSGTKYPRGTATDPVNNLTDALAILEDTGFKRLTIIGSITATAAHNLDNLTIEAGDINSGMILSGCSTVQTKFEGIGVAGTLSGRTSLDGCAIAAIPFSTLLDFHGQMERCYLLGPVTILADMFGSAFTDCFSYATFALDMDGQDTTVDFRNQAGNTVIRNLTTNSNIGISFDAGTLTVENTCTAGTITVEGVARVWDSSTGTCEVIQHSTVSKAHTDLINQQLEIQRKHHVGLGETYYWNPYDGDDSLDGKSKETSVKTFARAHDLVESGVGDHIVGLATNPSGVTHAHENIEVSKNDVMIRSVGREFVIHPHDYNAPTVRFTGEGSQLQSMQVEGAEYGFQNNIEIDAEHISIDTVWINNARLHGVYLTNTKYSEIKDCVIEHSGQYFTDPSVVDNPSDLDDLNPSVDYDADGIFFGYNTKENIVENCTIWDTQGDGIYFDAGGGYCTANQIKDCEIFDNTGYGIHITADTTDTLLDTNNTVSDNTLGDINDEGQETYYSGIDNIFHYDGKIFIDVVNGKSGIYYPVGTTAAPVNSLEDALSIAVRNGFTVLYIIGNITIGATDDISGYTLIGEGATFDVPQTTITLTTGCVTASTFFKDCRIEGKQNGEATYIHCVIGTLTNIYCQFEDCELVGPAEMSNEAGTENYTSDLVRCHTSTDWYILDYNNSSIQQIYTNFSGNIKIINCTAADAEIDIRMDSGSVWLNSSCTDGNIKVAGIGLLIDESDGAIVINRVLPESIWDTVFDPSTIVPGSYGDELINGTTDIDAAEIADAVWEETAADHTTGTTMGGKLNAASAGGVDYDALADAVWDEDITTHITADSAGEKLEEASAGGDPNTTADAVWDKVINASEQVPGSYGAEISNISDNMGTISDEALYSLSTTVDAPIAGFLTTQFTMVDGRAVDDAYENCIIALQDQTDNHIEMRRISAYVGATKQVTVDRAFSFDVVNGDIISISKLSYGGATSSGSGSGPKLED